MLKATPDRNRYHDSRNVVAEAAEDAKTRPRVCRSMRALWALRATTKTQPMNHGKRLTAPAAEKIPSKLEYLRL